MRMPAIREIAATDWIGEAWSLIEANRAELMTDKDIMVLDPDVRTYCLLEDANAMLSLGAFDDDEIVGYSVNILAPSPHCRNVIICSNNVLYLREDKRQGLTGLKLMRETERLAKERGAHMMLWHAKPETNLNQILPRIGYRTQDIVYTRVL
jgi:predicted GNAT superfamily acetyltransferase